MVRRKKKLPSIRALRKKAWKIFSVWIRSVDADHAGYVNCYTCGFAHHWKQMNAGHYRHDSHDFDIRNVKVQCPACNLAEKGRADQFYLHLVRDYGKDVADTLRTRPKWNNYSRDDLNEIIKKYSFALAQAHIRVV